MISMCAYPLVRGYLSQCYNESPGGMCGHITPSMVNLDWVGKTRNPCTEADLELAEIYLGENPDAITRDALPEDESLWPDPLKTVGKGYLESLGYD